MAAELLEILETAAIAISGFLIKKYVFLEPDMEAGKQRIFYVLSFIVIGVVFFVFGKDAASLAALFMIGLNICLGRKKHRLWGMVLIIPFSGIINGLLVPVLLVPLYLFAMSAQEMLLYQFALYGILTMLLILFYVKGRKWRSWFRENMQHRSLRKSEKYLLWVIGILMLFFSNQMAMQITQDGGNVRAADGMYGRGLAPFIGIASVSGFVMTVTIIVLIMQGCIAKELKRQGVYRDILTDRYMSDMVVAAPLHDIGKIHIPDAVLNKPGKLTEEEFEIMKTHTTAGEELLTHAKAELGESGYLNMAVEMAAYHHEWWNGKGYPYGISGEKIPLCARIMAVADVFDALTSRRCYKSAMPPEKAYAIIREESGTHFDPAVAEAFLAAVSGRDKG